MNRCCVNVQCFVVLALLVASGFCGSTRAETASHGLFQTGVDSFHAGEYAIAATAFRQAAAARPSSGALQNLGLAEWQLGQTGPAVLAWEQALWMDPFNGAVRENLRFARKTAQLESPELAWYEVVSTWLPMNAWAWVAGASLWGAVGLLILPGIFRLRRAAWHQAVAAVGFALFLLCLPAHLGVDTRSRMGFIIQKDTPLRLTPTEDAQTVTRLAPGEPARLQRVHGRFVLLRTNRALGWIKRDEFAPICPGT